MDGISQSALEALYRSRYVQFVRVATGILHHEERAVEAVQEAFAKALKSRKQFRREGPLEAWVWRIVVNEALHARVVPQPTPAPDEPVDVRSESASPEVREAVAALPERQRLAVFLRYYADLDYASIASVLAVRPGTVAATLHSAHSALRASLQEVPR